jgi:rhamnulokinase
VTAVQTEADVRVAAGLEGAGIGQVARCVIDSIAAAVADAIRELSDLIGRPVPEVHLVGGGTANPVLVTALEEASGATMLAGPKEATALGNALAQGIALGRWDGLASAREALAISATTAADRPVSR